jgi:hypothetical protein
MLVGPRNTTKVSEPAAAYISCDGLADAVDRPRGAEMLVGLIGHRQPEPDTLVQQNVLCVEGLILGVFASPHLLRNKVVGSEVKGREIPAWKDRGRRVLEKP